MVRFRVLDDDTELYAAPGETTTTTRTTATDCNSYSHSHSYSCSDSYAYSSALPPPPPAPAPAPAPVPAPAPAPALAPAAPAAPATPAAPAAPAATAATATAATTACFSYLGLRALPESSMKPENEPVIHGRLSFGKWLPGVLIQLQDPFSTINPKPLNSKLLGIGLRQPFHKLSPNIYGVT